jgi:hypothetical protein
MIVRLTYEGLIQWEGPLSEFLSDHGFGENERAFIVTGLGERGSVTLGGGATPQFKLALAPLH